jgi:hypothetical protein
VEDDEAARHVCSRAHLASVPKQYPAFCCKARAISSSTLERSFCARRVVSIVLATFVLEQAEPNSIVGAEMIKFHRVTPGASGGGCHATLNQFRISSALEGPRNTNFCMKL